MAILDKLNTFCTATACSATSSTRVQLGDIIDWTATYGPGGGNQPVWLMIHFTADTTAADAGATYVDFTLLTDADGTIPTAGIEVATFRILTADMAPGKTHYFPIGGGTSRFLRYLSLCESSTEDWTTHPTVYAGLVLNPQTAPQ